MKKSILFTALLFAGSQFLHAQTVNETVSIGAGYANETWYSLENGEQGTKSASDWDLGFDLSSFGTSIRINSANGILLYSYPDGDINDWANVDITDVATWSEMYNSESTWFTGAFDQNTDPSNPFDVGWGIYNQNTHVISGDSIFVIKLMDDSYRKLRIDEIINGAFNFTYANIDGTNEIQSTVVKADYVDKLFGYYSIQNETAVDHEPVTVENWDLFFGKYTGFIPTPYNLTGIMVGPNTEVVRIDGVNNVAGYNDWAAETFTSEINTIGADWKEFDMATMSYTVADDRVYFVKTEAGDVWKVIPTGFGGSSTGNFEFTKEKVSTLSINENGLPKSEVVVYPNPASESVSLILNNMNSTSATVQIMNLNGQVLFNENYAGSSNFEVKNISTNSLKPGVYMVNVSSDNQQISQKLIIK